MASGRYLLFLNAGDRLAHADTLEKVAKATKTAPDFIYGDALETDIKIDNSPRISGKNTASPKIDTKPFYKAARRYRDLPRGMFTHHQAMFYKLDIIRKHKLWYSIIYEVASDYEFTAVFLQHAKKIVRLPIPICLFESGGISQKKVALGRREQFIIRDKLKMVSLPENVYIYFLQKLAWFIRQKFPALYAHVKKPKKPNPPINTKK